MQTVLITTQKELADTLRGVLQEMEAERKENSNLKSFSIHQVAKKLGRAHATIKKYVESGILKTTKDGRIPEVELIRFLEAEK